MWRKRKASSLVTAHHSDDHRGKRWKDTFVVSSSDDEDQDENEDEGEDSGNAEDEWDIKCILDESRSQYLIDWGDSWSPTWEPKENANDVAIKIWEDKKRQTKKDTKTNKQSNPSSAVVPISSSSSPETPSRSPIQGSQAEGLQIERAERDTGQDYPSTQRNRSSSPLFVPFEDTSSEEEDIPLVRRSGQTPAHGGPSSSRVVPSSTQQSQDLSVFEYVQEDSIPLEFLLPGEAEDTPLVISQTGLSENDLSAPNTSKASRSNSPCVPVETEKPELKSDFGKRGKADADKSGKSPAQAQALKEFEVAGTPSASLSIPGSQRTQLYTENSQSDKAVEISETPSASLTAPTSQSTEFRPNEGTGTQFSSQPVNIQSHYSSLISQVYSSNDSTSSGTYSIYRRFTAAHQIGLVVPESIAPSHSQSSTATPSQNLNHQTLSIWNRFPIVPGTPKSTDKQSQNTEAKPRLSIMDKYSHIEGATPREKMRNAYAHLHAKNIGSFSPNPEPSETPSSSGDIQPFGTPSVPEAAPLTVRTEKEPAHQTSPPEMAPFPAEHSEPQPQMERPQQPATQTIQPSALSFNNAQEISPGSIHLGPLEFAIPLPMDSRVKDDYERILDDKAQVIRDFVQAGNADETERENLIPKVREILEQLSNVATHPDLNIAEHIKESESDLEKEAAWAEYSSAKFLFLGYLVQYGSDEDLHLAIMVQGGKTQQIVERYLLGKGLKYTRPRQEMGDGTNLEVSMAKGTLSFGIQSAQGDSVVETYKRPSAIISLDRSFYAKSPSVEHMRTTYARDGSLLPVVHLLISNTSEHIEHCFHDVPAFEHLRLVMQYTVRLRDMVGDLQDNALGVSEDVEEFLPCVQSDNFHLYWSLPAIEPLQIFSPEELDSAISRSNRSDANSEGGPTLATQKRSHGDMEEQSSKRQRVVDPSQETSVLTESSKFPSQTLGNDLQKLESNLVQLKTAHAAELENLQLSLMETQSRLQEREKAMEALQHRYEFRTKELHQVRQERDRVTQSKTTAEQRTERQKEEITKLKDERTELRRELEKAREELKSGGGSAAELEHAREEARRLSKEQSSLERRAEYEKNQAEYTREQYQNASNVAAQSSNENRTLREENETLKRKVAGDASRLREINIKNNDLRHLARVEELESTLSTREDLLRKKEEELREIRKNRPSTRSTSTQPRSPKWAAATSRPGSPGLNTNNNGNSGSNLHNNGLARGSALRFSSEMSL